MKDFVAIDKKDFVAIDKKCLDLWKQSAATVPDSTRKEILAMKKSGKSVREISCALELDTPEVSMIVIEEFAEERGETPVFPGEPLALLEKFYFYEGEFAFDVTKGSNSTVLHFTHRAEGEPSGGDHPDEVLIWIPTACLEALRNAL